MTSCNDLHHISGKPTKPKHVPNITRMMQSNITRMLPRGKRLYRWCPQGILYKWLIFHIYGYIFNGQKITAWCHLLGLSRHDLTGWLVTFHTALAQACVVFGASTSPEARIADFSIRNSPLWRCII